MPPNVPCPLSLRATGLGPTGLGPTGSGTIGPGPVGSGPTGASRAGRWPARRWSEWPGFAGGGLPLGVLTDIDDTLTTAGALDAAALAGLAALHAAGIPVIAVTGRPLGWSLPFARDWPIEAVVAENGAVGLWRDARGGVEVAYVQGAEERHRNRARLDAAAARVLREVPGARLARDSAGRATDIAIDHAEYTRLPPAGIEQVLAVMRAEGMNATVSSIHVNGWFGDHDKPSGARWAVQRRLGRRLDAELGRWVYVGDSTNDQAMFTTVPLSVGVANLLDFADRLTVWPAYLTAQPRGAGFAEVAERLLAAPRPSLTSP